MFYNSVKKIILLKMIVVTWNKLKYCTQKKKYGKLCHTLGKSLWWAEWYSVIILINHNKPLISKKKKQFCAKLDNNFVVHSKPFN